MKAIKLIRGKKAIIDDEDFEQVSKQKWCALYDGHNWYAFRNKVIQNKPYKQITESLHRFLLMPNKGQEVDHINGDTLDNRRCNLRVCTHAENTHNSRKPKTGLTSKYKGVDWYNPGKKFRARIHVYRVKRKSLGYFKDEIKAALAYDAAALKYYGEFARLNFPPPSANS